MGKFVEETFNNFLSERVDEDLRTLKLPKGVLEEIKKLDIIRQKLDAEKMDKFFVPFLIKKQAEIAGR